jgi:hypothetical protein
LGRRATKNKRNKEIRTQLVNIFNVYESVHRDTTMKITNKMYFFLWRCAPTRVMASSFLRFLDHTQRRTTVGRTSLDE